MSYKHYIFDVTFFKCHASYELVDIINSNHYRVSKVLL